MDSRRYLLPLAFLTFFRMASSRHLYLLSFAFCLLTFLACGRKGPVRPPEDVLPKPITDLSASNTPQGIQLSWSRPRTYANGAPMSDLGGFVIERSTGTGPQAPFRRLVELEVNDRDRYRQIKRFSHIDTDTSVETPYRYRVVSFTVDRYVSAPSNVVTLERTATAEESHAPLPTPQR
jgi:predicted small lipoprotein YifL